MAIANKVCEEHDASVGASALQSPKLKQHNAIRLLSAALGEQLLKFYDFGAVKGDTLIFYFKHQAIVPEFDRQKSDIMQRMRDIWTENEMKNTVVKFRQISAEVKHGRPEREEPKEVEPDTARGEFQIHVDDPELRKRFEKIRTTIQRSHQGGG